VTQGRSDARSSTDPTLTVGIDIGGTSVRGAVVDADGRTLTTVRAFTPDTVPATEDLLVSVIDELGAGHPVAAVGLAVAGFVSVDRRRVMFAPHLAWRADPVPARISARVGLPVTMDHDVNSAAWAEYRLGAAMQSPLALLLAIGTGIGAGLVADGQIQRGAHGVAPELGHLIVQPGGRPCPCGKRGCWERYCSGTALAASALERWAAAGQPVPDGLDADQVTGSVVARVAAEGDPIAAQAVRELGEWLAFGLAIIADVIDPELVVIGGGVSGAAEDYLPVAMAALPDLVTGGRYRPLPRIEVARFGDRAGVIGASLLARQALSS
jgi:glucokinase